MKTSQSQAASSRSSARAARRKAPRSGAERIAAGKQVGGALYLHLGAVAEAPMQIRSAVSRTIRRAKVEEGSFNVVKVEGNPVRRVSLLAYEDFDASPFPALLDSWTVDHESGRVTHRTYRMTANPPILHRKELLLSISDPRRPRFGSLTRELEQRGLFEHVKSIGFRREWGRRLAEAGVEIRDHKVVAAHSKSISGAVFVERHRTAMARQQLSLPMQALARHGLLEGDRSILDYGCGRGDDLAVLAAAGIPAQGWDPHFRPNGKLAKADVVNLGFVLNVIEEPGERRQAVEKAFALARQCLAVAVMLAERSDLSGLRSYRDGFLTSRGTFQRYFTQDEIREFLESVAGVEAIAVGPGIFFLFRDKMEEQRFLARRHRRATDISHLLSITPPAPAEVAPELDLLLEENREIVDAVWETALGLGRVPHPEELRPEVKRALEERIGSIRKTMQLGQRVHDPAGLGEARAARVDDLTVVFALNLFNRRRPYQELPADLQRDVKAFFGSYRHATDAGRELLFSLGKPQVIMDACRQACSEGCGHLFEDHSLQLHASLIDRLPAPLRAYVGCAEKLFGDINESNTDIVKIHIQSGKLTLLRYEDFDGTPLPRLRERIKIKMRDQAIDFFTYSDERSPQFLTMKSRYITPEQEGYSEQQRFDEALQALGLFDLNGLGPGGTDLYTSLAQAGYRVRGFKLERGSPLTESH